MLLGMLGTLIVFIPQLRVQCGVILDILQAMFNVWPIGQVFYNKWIIDACEKSALINVKSAYLVWI